MVENIVWCHGETTDLESDCSVYSMQCIFPKSLFGLSFNLNSFRISFSLRRVTLVFLTLLECFPHMAYENPWAFHKEDDTAFLCYYYWHNELETSFPRTGVGRKLNRTFLLFIRHRLGDFIGNKCNNRGGDTQDGNWVCVTHCVSQARETMVAVLVAVVMMLVMLTMTAAGSYRAMHCISVFGGASCYIFMATFKSGLLRALFLLSSLQSPI